MESVEVETASDPASSVMRWVLPSLSQWLWVVFFLVLLMPARLTQLVASDGDACMHWRVGEYMLQHREVIRSDVFSYTCYGKPIVSKEWLSEILFAMAGRIDGLTGLGILAALVIATTMALLHRQLVRDGSDVLVATLLVLVAAWASQIHWHARPHIFSLLLLVLWNELLRKFERSARVTPLAVGLAVLTVLWVNLHGGYLAGFIVLASYWVGTAINMLSCKEQPVRTVLKGKLVALTWVALLCVVVSLCNPNGYLLHVHNIQFLRSHFFANWLDEYSSTNFHTFNSLGFLAWLAILLCTLILLRPRLSATSAILLLSWICLALYAARNIPMLAILTAPIIAPVISEYSRSRKSLGWERLSARVSQINTASNGWPIVAIVATIAVLLMAGPTEVPAKSWPVAAIQYVQQHDDLFTGNMFNHYNWGSYLLWALPNHKVFIDGRADFYGESFAKEFDDVDELRVNWMEAFDNHKIRWTLLPARHHLNLLLALSSEWKRVYSDEVASIYRREP